MTYISGLTEPVILSLIAAAIGLASGLLISVFLYIFGRHYRADHFHDKAYWQDLADTQFNEEASELMERINIRDKYQPGNLLG